MWRCAYALPLGAMMVFSVTANAQEAAQSTAPTAGESELPAVEVVQETPVQKAARAKKKAVAVTPLSSAPPAATPEPTGEVAPIKVPSAVTTVSDDDIERDGTAQIQQVLLKKVPGVVISDAAGNPLRAEVSYRGFDASPVSGRSQGVAVYQNGVRINETFGDTVNWDVLPSNAIASLSVVSNNPSFGLNALGGAISILMKDGFSYEGAEVDVMGGSFGRRQVGVQAGASSGNAGVYAAGEWIEEDSFRDFSDSEIKRFYGDVGLRGSFAEFHVSLTAADNHFGATAAAPIELLQSDWSNTFTSPQTTDLEVYMPTISASVKATETLTFSGVGYYRYYKSSVVDGNLTEIGVCENVVNTYCLEPGDDEEVVEDLFGDPIEVIAGLDPLGSIERLNTESESWGGAVEGQERTPVFGRPNLFIAGLSYDRGRARYRTSSELGEIQENFVVEGSGTIVGGVDNEKDEGDELAPRDLKTENTYFGLYFSDAFDVTDRLTVMVGGRYNYARIKLEDQTGEFDGLNATNTYERFNPMAGVNFKLLPSVSVYGGYSESNRAPTPAELGCAEENNPCLIESFLTDDPPLEQVVGRTGEIGLRGQGFSYGGRYTWGAGLFRTLASDDILPITSETGRIFFVNAGDTLRQGVELSATYETSKWNVYASYAYVDATLDTCNDPSGECAFLEEGDRLPGIPRHRFKAGVEYWLTSKWKVGADLVAASNQPFFPNKVSAEAEEEGEPLPALLGGYTRVDLHTSYDITKNIQVYGFIKNLFDQRYGLYGTYFEAGELSDLFGTDDPGFEDSRTISPAMPFAAYGGVRVKF